LAYYALRHKNTHNHPYRGLRDPGVLGLDKYLIVVAEAYGELPSRSEIISVVREDEADGGYTATALSYGIHTQGETLEQLRAMVKAAVGWYFDETVHAPKIIRVHFVRDEVLV
jgi:predicted RNase H-like HicB family nuclease